MASLDAVLRHADEITGLQALAVRAGRRAWARVSSARISESLAEAMPDLLTVTSGIQRRAAISGADYGAMALAEQGLYTAPSAFVDVNAFSGVSSDGRPLRGLLESPAYTAKSLIIDGMDPDAALAAGGKRLDRILRTLVGDAGRGAAGVDLAVRPNTGYVRQLVGSSCPACVVLAGRFYRWNDGFKRHPGDDCVHVPTTKAASDGVLVDPYAHFAAMTEEEQDALWGKADAQAIRDGADVYRVYNARRGKKGMFTDSGGSSASPIQLKPGQRRLTPEGIYKLHPNREDARQQLEYFGYILPGGQRPGGSIRGANYEGFGEMGRGGTRRAASDAVLRARETGVRDPAVRYTMTAAERRVDDAKRNWEDVLAGRNPYASPGFGQTPDPTGRLRTPAGPRQPLTPEIAAQVEKTYRRAIRTGGQAYAG